MSQQRSPSPTTTRVSENCRNIDAVEIVAQTPPLLKGVTGSRFGSRGEASTYGISYGSIWLRTTMHLAVQIEKVEKAHRDSSPTPAFAKQQTDNAMTLPSGLVPRVTLGHLPGRS